MLAKIGDTVQFHETPPEDVARELASVEGLIAWISEHCRVAPLPTVAAEPGKDDRRELFGRESFGAMEIGAAYAASLYADDLGLRTIFRNDYDGPGFSTYGFVQAAARSGILTNEARDAHVLRLIELQHHFIPVTGEFLHNVLRARGYQLDGSAMRAFARLGGAEVNEASALGVAAALVRDVALSPIGRASVRSVATACAEALANGRPLRSTLARFVRLLAAELALAPTVLAEALAAVKTVSDARARRTSPTDPARPGTA